MKRVLVLNYEYPPIGGGAATATYNMLRVLSERDDIQIDLVTSSANKFRVERFAKNITIHFLDIGKNDQVHLQSNKDLLTYSWKSFWYCRKLKKEKGFDLTHAFFGIPCGFIAMFLGLPYIISLRGSDVPFYSDKYRFLDTICFSWLSKIIWSRAKNVVANSEGLKELALETRKNQNIEVIYNGVDTELFYPNDDTKEFFTVISTSRLIERKGINLLVEAFIEFAKKRDKVKLVLAGDGNLRGDLEEIVLDNDMTKKVIFLGALSRKEMPELYRKSDVFVLPSLNEGMSNSLLEAMASGLAIIATDTGGTKELVSEKNGVIIKKGERESILKALENLYAKRDVLEKKKGSSRERAIQMSWEQMAEMYLKRY